MLMFHYRQSLEAPSPFGVSCPFNRKLFIITSRPFAPMVITDKIFKEADRLGDELAGPEF